MLQASTGSTILNPPAKERQERDKAIADHASQIVYSVKYYDDEFEYRFFIFLLEYSNY